MKLNRLKKVRYIAIDVPGQGWRIWSTPVQEWWGETFPTYPTALLDELNGQKRTDQIMKLLHS
ncbi:hypothetical protein [Deinococcus ficus]|uniref:hypothetical protein n=1 Tax=Deinococcus ficus TaxID=317577 RepID=UPI0012DF55C9|nr:hypothetical protein [Deinococcus ficus]